MSLTQANPNPLEAELDAMDHQIRDGQGAEVRGRILELCGSKIPRENWVRLASLARRVSLYLDALKLLHPLVRPTGKSADKASDEERAEYAANLTYVGAPVEALRLLSRVNPEEALDSLLFSAWAHFAQWDYASAIPLLKKYVGSPLEGYWKLVGNVNLAAALIYERKDLPAEALLRELMHTAHLRKAQFLYASTLELAAQNHIHLRKWDRAEKYLEEAQALLSPTETWYGFHVRKWRAVLSLFREKERATEEMKAVREEALRLRHWETLRDCDRFECLKTQDEATLLRLYFGTPFPAFRQKLLKDSAAFSPKDFPESYVWQRGSEETPFDAEAVSELEPGSVPHRLFVTLCSDFYRPWKVASLYCHLFPEEYYNPLTSPSRVHEAVRRLRKVLETHGIEIFENEGEYQLRGNRSIVVKGDQAKSKRDVRLEVLWEKFGKEPFSATEASGILSITRRSVTRLLDKAIEENSVTVSGKGKATRYRFC